MEISEIVINAITFYELGSFGRHWASTGRLWVALGAYIEFSPVSQFCALGPEPAEASEAPEGSLL